MISLLGSGAAPDLLARIRSFGSSLRALESALPQTGRRRRDARRDSTCLRLFFGEGRGLIARVTNALLHRKGRLLKAMRRKVCSFRSVADRKLPPISDDGSCTARSPEEEFLARDLGGRVRDSFHARLKTLRIIHDTWAPKTDD